MLIYMLPAIIGLGVVTSYEDIQKGKIHNTWVGIAMLYAVVVYSLVFIISYLSGALDINYLLQTVTNLVFSLVLGYGIFHFNLWSAGDGKLFIAFSWLIPISVYEVGYEPYFPSILFLINTLILSLLILFISQIRGLRRRKVVNAMRGTGTELLDPKLFLISVVGLFVIQWVVQGLLSLLNYHSTYLSIALTVLLFSQLSRLGPKFIMGAGVVGALRLIFDHSVYSFSFLLDFLVLVIVWKILRSFLRGSLARLAQELNRKKIPPKDLRPGMFLCESISVKKKVSPEEFEKLKKEWRTDILVRGSVAYIKKESTLLEKKGIFLNPPGGMTARQVRWLRGFGFGQYRVTRQVPFAPLFFLGAGVTIVVRGNLIQAIIGMV